jgi:hypothetical protein
MIHRVTPRMMVYGTKAKYGEKHMKPGPYGRPIRRAVDLTEVNKVVIVKTLQLYLVRGIARMAGNA